MSLVYLGDLLRKREPAVRCAAADLACFASSYCCHCGLSFPYPFSLSLSLSLCATSIRQHSCFLVSAVVPDSPIQLPRLIWIRLPPKALCQTAPSFDRRRLAACPLSSSCSEQLLRDPTMRSSVSPVLRRSLHPPRPSTRPVLARPLLTVPRSAPFCRQGDRREPDFGGLGHHHRRVRSRVGRPERPQGGGAEHDQTAGPPQCKRPAVYPRGTSRSLPVLALLALAQQGFRRCTDEPFSLSLSLSRSQLANALSQNCGKEMHRELSSRAFTDALLKLAGDRNTHTQVKAKILERAKEWSDMFNRATRPCSRRARPRRTA
ncbi:hypothetical protein VTK73DRAFT_3776 [Phialemonium thermophilum]|uniref:VHS domain-containing protein n=1 Tax=Phialemonium thermophilum TaxID=223376 RepID=A0ABR3VGZ5_9PEZI